MVRSAPAQHSRRGGALKCESVVRHSAEVSQSSFRLEPKHASDQHSEPRKEQHFRRRIPPNGKCSSASDLPCVLAVRQGGARQRAHGQIYDQLQATGNRHGIKCLNFRLR